ncbi:quinone oxidoreductase 2 [Neofusicoccum parvum]|uniref:Quinone oxidoreductase 2 n=1 Tax=Neofusicoccum parvum TaxID=310453 RepID=A0ACB5RPA7_9PEZI|nr:quinone oxidoreductase 2 [Neofusicoccum parvum]GME48812.1 quinone oxidoreductase 2 [Neofusicoccum parvum]
MPKYVLTGCDGHLGSIAASHAASLLRPGDELVLTSHAPSSIPTALARAWAAAGATLLPSPVSYDDVAGLARAFAGAAAVSFVSTWLIGAGRRAQHRNVVDAAVAAGVARICYTSFVGAGLGGKEEELPFLPRDHAWTERLIRESGLEYCFQRNYLYADNIPQFFAQSFGFCGDRWLCNSGGAKGAFVAREDCGRVLGALLMGKGEPNTAYAVTGPEPVTYREVFEWMAEQTGYKGEFVEVSDEELEQWWKERGLPYDVYGDFSKLPCKLCMYDLLCCGQMVAWGHMGEVTDSVEKLTGRKPLPFKEALLKYRDIFPV